MNYLFQCFTGFYGFRWFCKKIGGFWDNFLEDLSELGSKSDPLLSSILELFWHHFLWYLSSISWHFTGFSCTSLTSGTMRGRKNCVFCWVLTKIFSTIICNASVWIDFSQIWNFFLQTLPVRRGRNTATPFPRSTSQAQTPAESKLVPSTPSSLIWRWRTAHFPVLIVPKFISSLPP